MNSMKYFESNEPKYFIDYIYNIMSLKKRINFGPSMYETENGRGHTLVYFDYNDPNHKIPNVYIHGEEPIITFERPGRTEVIRLTINEYRTYFKQIEKIFVSNGKFEVNNNDRKFSFELKKESFKMELFQSGRPRSDKLELPLEHLENLLISSRHLLKSIEREERRIGGINEPNTSS